MLTILTQGAFDPFPSTLIRAIGQYMCKVHIAGEYFVNFADGSAKAEVEGSLLYCYGKRIQSEPMMQLGAELYQSGGLSGQLRPLTFSLGRLVRTRSGTAKSRAILPGIKGFRNSNGCHICKC